MNLKTGNKTADQFIKVIAKDHPILAMILMATIMASGWIWERWQYMMVPAGECLVKNVYDGDTMALNCGGEEIKVRMYCIDAPEMQQEPWGRDARDHLKNLTGFSVRYQQINKDNYGRIVSELWNGEINLNLRQVRDGKVAVYSQYCKDSVYPEAERLAKKEKLGIWSKPGNHQTPWNWRKINK